MLREINPFAQSDLQMYRLVQEHPATSVKMVFLEDKNLDMRRYNAPTLCTEVAAIFVGSPRHMQQNYQDAMAMVRKFGKPDLFLTFTCKPSWSEILNSMEGVQRPEDRPDIIVRVFNMKLKELLEDMCKHGIFGTVLAYIYVIEF
ncbi:hypothetical protein AVEN_62807-1 [Araneus ventricosus]|uniref:Helitron helicase-like domain-containing protein n=1 Tax=Araneus ventricosus TaxID=182803 RepID=A0A4Y2P3Q9_ARAVE|nr:hypothetical protein AVEN_62807-1 [Araneus ventricosus]